MRTNRPERIWLAMFPYSEEQRVRVTYSTGEELWAVTQNGMLVIRCSHLYLRDVEFHPETREISGFIATAKEIRDLEESTLGNDECSEYVCVVYSDDLNKFIDELDIEMIKCPYVDMHTWDVDKVLAIYPQTKE